MSEEAAMSYSPSRRPSVVVGLRALQGKEGHSVATEQLSRVQQPVSSDEL